jgi:hypothetical protein
MSETHYEMLWNCGQCGAVGLLAKSQRHCPTCGAPQDPARRYFPEPGQEVEATGHRYLGADWRCAYCESPNGAAAAFCANCGGPKEGTREVARVADPKVSVPEVPPSVVVPATRPAGRPWGRAAAALAALAIAALGWMFFSKHEETVTVTGNQWAREIRVERLQSASESAWCADLPGGAYEVRRTREVREHRRVEDGQNCREVRVDKGDGTFTRSQECTPRYRDEPVHADKCHYRVNRWMPVRTESARGDAALAPSWPALQLATGQAPLGGVLGSGGISGALQSPGAEREAGRSETYSIALSSAGGKTFTCVVGAEKWARYRAGQVVRIQVRGTGGAVCDTLP